MKIIERSKHKEDIIIDKNDETKIECFEILVETPETIDPGSKLEVRYLNFLIQKYSKNDCESTILLEE